MKTYLTCLVIYFSIFGSSNQVDSVSGTAVTFSDNTTAENTGTITSTVVTQTSPDSTLTFNSSSTPLASGTVSTQSAATNAQQITNVSPGRSGKISSTTTTSPGPWRAVGLSLIAVSGVLLLAFTITIIILCKMRSKLGQASKTLYPITTSPEANEYLDLESGTQKKYKKGAKVELTHMTSSNTDEEFDSPTFPPTPPVKPKRTAPPPVPESQPPSVKFSADAPQLPSRPKNKFPLSKTSRENLSGKTATEQAKLQSNESNSMIGETNKAFEIDVAKNGGGNGIINPHDSDDDDFYESYEHGYNGNPVTVADDFDDADIQASYEDPVKSSAGNLIQRQGSSTGLPELAIQRESSREQVQDAPLQEAEEDEEFHVEDFGNVGPESGLPDMTGMTHIDDLQYFDDPDAIAAPVNETNEDSDDLKNKEDERQDASSSTSDSMDDLLTYDDADMVLDNIDEIQDDDSEPGFYDDFDMGQTNGLPDNINAKRENVEADEFELPKVPPRRKSTIDKNRRSEEDTKINEVTSDSESPTVASGAVPDQSGFPSVPLRRNILRNQSETESADETFNETVPRVEIPPAINMDTFPGEMARLRPGKKIEEKRKERPRDSYFLDVMDENPMEFSGFSEMSNGNAHLSEFGENNTEFE